ncbi:hypothetical protein H5410_024676 [Solanum commersonii]|uniref:Uncharacterized protein n=1 Tax=Solanum commersonii TaxID=4109 RepID=A0A9J5ZMN1_SOLCO|nr:hypothetical protein H5410_024676 [Solanum commersonii]
MCKKRLTPRQLIYINSRVDPRRQIRPGSGSNRSGSRFHTFGAAPEEIAHCPVEAEAIAEEDHGYGNGRNSSDKPNSVNEYCSNRS